MKIKLLTLTLCVFAGLAFAGRPASKNLNGASDQYADHAARAWESGRLDDQPSGDLIPPPLIQISATGYKVKGSHTVDLHWSQATTTHVDIFRDGVLVATVPNSGFYTDSIGARGHASYRYQVIEVNNGYVSDYAYVTF